MKIVTEQSLVKLIKLHGFENFLKDLIFCLKKDFARWDKFTIIPRPGMYVENGVMELMPICDNEKYFTFKYVNLHPANPKLGKQTIIATGQLVDINTGYPLMYSEMTVLTALRTAAMSALVTDLMARQNSRVFALVATGAQSEFQTKAVQMVRDISEIRYFDIDKKAMDKYGKNFKGQDVRLVRCKSVEEAVLSADIITTCTACYGHMRVLKNEFARPGMHINAIGGDSRGKTELEPAILPRAKIAVEYFDQSKDEGEIQVLGEKKAGKMVFAEISELVTGVKMGRTNRDEITLYDSVGIALEDYSALCLTYKLCQKYGLGEEIDMTPDLEDPKDLYSLLN